MLQPPKCKLIEIFLFIKQECLSALYHAIFKVGEVIVIVNAGMIWIGGGGGRGFRILVL